MAGQILPTPTARMTNADGTPDVTWYQRLQQMWDSYNRTASAVGSSSTGLDTKAANVQAVIDAVTFKFPEDETVYLVLNNEVPWTITAVHTITEVGTSTVTIKVNGVALAGGANSATTSIATTVQSTDVAVGDAISVAFSSTSSDCENLCVQLSGSMTLA